MMDGQSNTKGAGVRICRMVSKGNVDYKAIPELKNVDLKKYRKAPIEPWQLEMS